MPMKWVYHRISSVYTPPQIIASKGIKQVGGITSTERGFNTTIISCVNAIGNSVPPVFVFPCVNFKNHMLNELLLEAMGLDIVPAGQVVKYLSSFWTIL